MAAIRAVSADAVAFTIRADNQGGKRLVRVPGEEFVRRFMQHILPSGIKRIRHYGVLASACKRIKLSAVRLALQMPPPNPSAVESAQAFMVRVARIDVLRCPRCKVGSLRVTAILSGQKRLPEPERRPHGAPANPLLRQGRGPP